jgi:23S rRNA (cytidine1920-2'-O)/16S rRNA (cytidine1409-2'-O)-methyltransferase
LKPQFEADSALKNKGIIKNEAMRRRIFKDFEEWARRSYKIIAKADSAITGEKGNKERFYLLRKLA